MAKKNGDHQDALEGYKVIAASTVLLEQAMATLRNAAILDANYAVRSRVKSHARLLNKLDQKRIDRPHYGIADVSDLVGIRLISVYRRDISLSVGSVLELISGGSGLNPNPLLGSKLQELISYTSNSLVDEDPVNVELKSIYDHNMERETGVHLDLVPRNRYSSVHMVIRCSIDHEGQKYSIPIEFQFRSIFEDAWAEIDHKLLYEMGRYAQSVDESHREVMAQHMAVLKKMMDTAADYADVIRRTVVPAQSKSTTIARNLDDADYIKELAARAGISREFSGELSLALSNKIELDSYIDARRPDVSVLKYIEIANDLAKLGSLVKDVLEFNSSSAAKTLIFSIRMEESLCRLLSNEDVQVRLAVDLYSSIVSEFPNHPAAWLRLAQAQNRLADALEAQDPLATELSYRAATNFGKAVDQMRSLRNLPDEERILIISPNQEDYIDVNAARLQGFTLWRISDRRRQEAKKVTEADLTDVLNAYRTTYDALKGQEKTGGDSAARSKRTLANNVLYYAVDLISLSKELNQFDVDLPNSEELKFLLTLVEDAAAGKITISQYDTILRAKLVLGDINGARAAATAILDLNSDEGNKGRESAYLSEVRERATRFAWNTLRADVDGQDLVVARSSNV